MARASRFKSLREESSKGHILLGEILRECFPIGKIYQEYPLDLVLKQGYKDQNTPEEYQDKFMLARAKKLRADWVVLDRRLVVEFHGEHHFSAVDYGDGKGEENLQHRIHLDRIKRSIVKESGFTLIEWDYRQKLTKDALMHCFEEAVGS